MHLIKKIYLLYVKLIEGKRVRDFMLSPLGSKETHLKTRCS